MRGAGRRGGQGQGGGKRMATTPVGGPYKDQRRNIQGNEDFNDDEDDWTEVTRTKQRSPTNQQAQPQEASTLNMPSFASIAAQQPSSSRHQQHPSAQNTSQQLRRNSDASVAAISQRKPLNRIFKTAPPNGPMRDELVIEIQKINGKPFKGQLTFTEAKDGIFVECLDLNVRLIHGIRFRFNTYPTIKFKLKEQINIDDLHHHEYFEFKREYKMKGEWVTDTFECKINGIRSNTGDQTQADPDPNIRWVKIEWTDYSIEEPQIMAWLTQFGEPAGELSEEIYPNSDSDADPIGNGTLSIKMRLKKDIPQLLPMWGKRVRIYYRGVQKLCSNCFGPHPRKNCRSERVTWIAYCLRFMENNREIPQDLYGKWWNVVNDHYGKIIEEETEEEMADQQAESNSLQASNSVPANHTIINTSTQHSTRGDTLSKEEEENLSDYLKLGMSITEAREYLKKEIEMAEIKMKIRDNNRAINRGAISRTSVGPSSSSAGSRRGGLTFN